MSTARAMLGVCDREAGQAAGDADGEARRRAGAGHQGLAARARGLGLDGRDAAQQVQHDAAHGNALGAGHERVGELVDEHRDEEQQRRGHGDDPDRGRRPGLDRRTTWVASDQVTATKMRIQLGWMAMSMPNRRPILKPDPMVLLRLGSLARVVPGCAGRANGYAGELDDGVEAVGHGQHAGAGAARCGAPRRSPRRRSAKASSPMLSMSSRSPPPTTPTR